MKLNRAQPQDLNDLRAIWPLIRQHFANAAGIVDAFYEAFPAAPHDEHLDNFIVEELGKGGYDISPS